MIRRVGIILNRRNVGAADRRITLFSADGKHDVRARGTQKLASKLAGSLEPLTLVDVTVVRGRSGEQVTGSTIRDAYRLIHANLGRIAGAGVIASAVDQLVRGATDDAAPYKAVRESFVLLGRSRTNRDVLLAVSYGLWNVLHHLGYSPAIEKMSTSAPAKRLIAVLLAGNPNIVRRVRCSVATARIVTEQAFQAVSRVSEREIPAASFFRSVVTTRRSTAG